jgi:hypothetical protein
MIIDELMISQGVGVTFLQRRHHLAARSNWLEGGSVSTEPALACKKGVSQRLKRAIVNICKLLAVSILHIQRFLLLRLLLTI